MSTRSAILVPTDDGLRGVYHHWDGYPTGLGATLHELYNATFDHDLALMKRTLIDEHPAGWSSLFYDDRPWTLADLTRAGYIALGTPDCYCHGDQAEEANPIVCRCAVNPPDDQRECDGLFIEWEYVLRPEGLEVLASFDTGRRVHREGAREGYDSPIYEHVSLGVASWDAPFDGEAFERRAGELAEQRQAALA